MFDPNTVPDFDALVDYCVHHAAESMAATKREVIQAVYLAARCDVLAEGEWQSDNEIHVGMHALRAIRDKDFASYVLITLRRVACPNYFVY